MAGVLRGRGAGAGGPVHHLQRGPSVQQGSPEERLAFFQWLFDFEYGRLGLPEPDLVLYLDMPTERAVDMLRQRERDTHTQGDIHETDSAYLATCRQAALEAAERYGWTKIPCLDQEGRLRRIDEIHQDIWAGGAPPAGDKGEINDGNRSF